MTPYNTPVEELEVRVERLEEDMLQARVDRTIPYNTTVEELEIRVERLEEDMFQAQVDIGEAEIDIDSLEFSLQETVETVSNPNILHNYSTLLISFALKMEWAGKAENWPISKNIHIFIGGSKRGAPGMHSPYLGPNSFIFMLFSRKIGQNNRLAPPPWGLVPPSPWEILDPPLVLLYLYFRDFISPQFHQMQ